MKRIIVLVVSICIFSLLTACGGNNKAGVENPKVEQGQVEKKSAGEILVKDANHKFSLTLPGSWEGKYHIISTPEAVAVYHKGTWEKVGDAMGRLFTVLVFSPEKWESEGKEITDAVGLRAKYEVEGKAVYAIIYPSDIQSISAEQKLYEEYKEMEKDVPNVIRTLKVE